MTSMFAKGFAREFARGFGMILRVALLAGLLVLSGAGLWAQKPAKPEGVPEKPTSFVYDPSNVLNADQRRDLEMDLRRFRDSTSNEIAILLLRRIPEGESLDPYVNDVARYWGVGGKANNNGVLIAAFIDDRKVRIEVGYGLEPVLPDGLVGRIIRETIRPRFKEREYAIGLREAVAELKQAAKGEYNYKSTRRDEEDKGNWVVAILVAAVIFGLFTWAYWSDQRKHRRKGIYERGAHERDSGYSDHSGGWFFWGGSSGGSDSGSSSWDSGSDFGSFGGGDFGGGGASGDW